MFELLKKKIKSFIKKEKEEVRSEIRGTEEKKEAWAKAEKTEEKITKKEQPKKRARPKLTVSTKIKKKVIRKAKITEEDVKGLLWDFQFELLESDVSLEVAERICRAIRERLVGREISARESIEEITRKVLKQAVEEVIIEPDYSLIKKAKSKKPFIIMFLGPNGHGKTTTIGKVAHFFQEKELSSVIAAADTFRAAAIEQVEKVGKKAGVKVIKHSYGADPTAVAFDAVKHAESKGIDVVLIDTAGRSELNKNLMEQIKKMQRVIKPDMIIYIGEALAGNAAVEEAKKFNEFVPIDGVIMTKADADVKGGSILSISYELKKPILFIGTGQELKDLMPFKKEWFLKQLIE